MSPSQNSEINSTPYAQPVSSLMGIVKFSSRGSGMDDSYHKEQGKKCKKLYNYISVQKRLKPKVCLSLWSRYGSASRARLPLYTPALLADAGRSDHAGSSHFAKLLTITVWFVFTSTDRILEYIQTSKQIKKSVGYICDSLWGYTVFWAEPVVVAWITLGRVTNCWDEFWSFFRIMRNKQAWGPKSDLLGSDLF